MMKLPFVAPTSSNAEQAAIALRLTCMKAIVADLAALAARPDNARTFLTRENRAQLAAKVLTALSERTPTNERVVRALVSAVVFDTELVEDRTGAIEVPRYGFGGAAFDPGLMGSAAVRAALSVSHRGRCAYCETLVDASDWGLVDPFRPPASYRQSSFVQYRPAYHWLAYEPRNLYLACRLCSQLHKSNAFPVTGTRAPAVDIGEEQAVLIDPYSEDPRAFIRFDPLNGAAFPFDAVAAFYGEKGKAPAEIEQLLWNDPKTIPGQRDLRGEPIAPALDAAFAEWFAAQREPRLRRGSITIATLGLNRDPLIRARVAHLRQMRGLYWTAGTTTTDAAAAIDLVNRLASNDPDAAALSVGYLSLTIDALQTWIANPAASDDVLAGYDAFLAKLPPLAARVPPPPPNPALCHVVLDSERKLAGRRRLAYSSAVDRLYGEPPGQGVTLSVDFERDLACAVIFTADQPGREVVAETTLGELLREGPAALRLFERSFGWVLGNYLPLDA